MMLIREGTMELTINGKPYRLGPGDVGGHRLERDAQREERRDRRARSTSSSTSAATTCEGRI
jgi:hypothetical protein